MIAPYKARNIYSILTYPSLYQPVSFLSVMDLSFLYLYKVGFIKF